MITILDYDAGNPTSVARALARLGQPSEITADAGRVAAADRIVFPGVGAAGSAMETLAARGLDQALREAAGRGSPILGICLGCQIVMDQSDEDATSCLGLLPGRVVRLAECAGKKIPHMGWNTVAWERDYRLVRKATDLLSVEEIREAYESSLNPQMRAKAMFEKLEEKGFCLKAAYEHLSAIFKLLRLKKLPFRFDSDPNSNSNDNSSSKKVSAPQVEEKEQVEEDEEENEDEEGEVAGGMVPSHELEKGLEVANVVSKQRPDSVARVIRSWLTDYSDVSKN